MFIPGILIDKKRKRSRDLSWDNEDERELLLQREAKRSLLDSTKEPRSEIKAPKGKQENESMKAFHQRIRQETKLVSEFYSCIHVD